MTVDKILDDLFFKFSDKYNIYNEAECAKDDKKMEEGVISIEMKEEIAQAKHALYEAIDKALPKRKRVRKKMVGNDRRMGYIPELSDLGYNEALSEVRTRLKGLLK